MSTKFTPLHSFYILSHHFDRLAITPKWNTPYFNTRFIAADGRKITGINAAVNQKNAVLIRGLKQKNSVQLCNIHHPDNDCPWAKRPDIRTHTYTHVACSRLWDSRFGEIENKARTRKKNGRKLGRGRPPTPSFSLITCLYFRVPYTHASSLLSESLEQANTYGAKTDPSRVKKSLFSLKGEGSTLHKVGQTINRS